MIDTLKYYEEDDKFIDSIINDFNLLLITVTKIEKETLHKYLKPIDGRNKLIRIHAGKQTYFLGVFGQYNAVHVSCDNMGATSSQASIVTTMDAISFCKPEVVLMMGIAFGVGGKQKIGDVLVSESMMPYEIQRVGKTDTILRGVPGTACTLLVNRFKNTTDWGYRIRTRTPAIIPGEILSGEKLVDNPEFKALLLSKYPSAKGGEMEGFGLHAACDGRVKHWILVKAICDFADGNKKKRKIHNQKVATDSAINLCIHVFNSPYAFKDLKLFPVQINSALPDSSVMQIVNIPSTLDVESQILIEMKENPRSQSKDLPNNIQRLVRTYLSLDDQEKIRIAKSIGVFDESFYSLYPHIRDKQIFALAKEKNLLDAMWYELSLLIPFFTTTNPLKYSNNDNNQ